MSKFRILVSGFSTRILSPNGEDVTSSVKSFTYSETPGEKPTATLIVAANVETDMSIVRIVNDTPNKTQVIRRDGN